MASRDVESDDDVDDVSEDAAESTTPTFLLEVSAGSHASQKAMALLLPCSETWSAAANEEQCTYSSQRILKVLRLADVPGEFNRHNTRSTDLEK